MHTGHATAFEGDDVESERGGALGSGVHRTVAPAAIATLYAAALRARGEDVLRALRDRVERELIPTPLDLRPLETLPPEELAPVDWLARLAVLVPNVRGELVEASAPIRTTAVVEHAARAIAAAWEHVDVLRARGRVPFYELRRVARGLLAIDPAIRRALAGTELSLLCEDPAGRTVRTALVAIAVTSHLTRSQHALTTIAIAAMAQTMLDEIPRQRGATRFLAEIAAREPDSASAVVTAWEAMRLRRGDSVDEPTLHARLVALACEEARASMVAGRLSRWPLDGIDVRISRPAQIVELPSSRGADGRSTLARIPLTHVIATVVDPAVSVTLIVTDPDGGRHSVVFADGALQRVHSRLGSADPLDQLAAIASLPSESELAFFWRRDLLDGYGERAAIPAGQALLAVARAWDRARMGEEVAALSERLVLHEAVSRPGAGDLALTGAEDDALRWMHAMVRERGELDLSALLRGTSALPLLYTLMHLCEVHARALRCPSCEGGERRGT